VVDPDIGGPLKTQEGKLLWPQNPKIQAIPRKIVTDLPSLLEINKNNDENDDDVEENEEKLDKQVAQILSIPNSAPVVTSKTVEVQPVEPAKTEEPDEVDKLKGFEYEYEDGQLTTATPVVFETSRKFERFTPKNRPVIKQEEEEDEKSQEEVVAVQPKFGARNFLKNIPRVEFASN